MYILLGRKRVANIVPCVINLFITLTVDGSSGFKAEKDRYHLYVGLFCPYAHRTLLVWKLKGLDKIIPVTILDYVIGKDGVEFTDQVHQSYTLYYSILLLYYSI